MLKRVLGATLSAIPCFYVIAVLFGAPFFSHYTATLTFSIILSLICVFPLSIVIKSYAELDSVIFENRPSSVSQLIAHRIAWGGLFGAWLGAFVIPLDWDRWWQRWPLPCIFSAACGALIGSLIAACEYLTRYKRQKKKKAAKTS